MARTRGFQWNNKTKKLFSKGQEVVDNSASNLVNTLKNVGSATGTGVALTAQGNDSNIDLTLTAKGTGNVTVSSTGAIVVPKGTTAQAPTGAAGMLRYNTTLARYERYDVSAGAFVDIATQAAAAAESDDVSIGETLSVGTSVKNIDTFVTSVFDSAFYLAIAKDEINEEIAAQQVSLVHNNTSAFVSAGGGVRTGSNSHISYTADINSGTVRLRGTGSSTVNSVKFYKIGLGDPTSATLINPDVDSAVENIDTWAHASYRGAKYYISANNTGKTELQNIECMVVHNGTDAFITTYNDVHTGNDPLISLTADISGSTVRLRATGNEPNTAVKMYRVLLSDAQSTATSTNTRTVGATTVSSSATQIDTFTTDGATGCHYVITGHNAGASDDSIAEVFVVSDGTDAYVASTGISSKGTDQLTFTASLSGTTVTLSASSTSGGSTTVNGYRVQMLRTSGGAATDLQVLTSTTQTISGAKTFSNAVVMMPNLPTSDPGVAGQLWRSGTDLKISIG